LITSRSVSASDSLTWPIPISTIIFGGRSLLIVAMTSLPGCRSAPGRAAAVGGSLAQAADRYQPGCHGRTRRV
jgi:hypothetical protein